MNMQRTFIKLAILAVVLTIAYLTQKPPQPGAPASAPAAVSTTASAPVTKTGNEEESWAHPATLADHFARHGADFGAHNAEEYAAQATAFLQRAKATGLPAKRDHDGSLRIYEAATDTFGAYNANGTTRTFFKPGSPTYFERQPGEIVDLRTAR